MRTILPFLTCLLFLIIPQISIKAENEDVSLINSYEEDLTGDGFHEQFTLNGILLSDESKFYRDIWLDISSPFSKQWKISLESGYNPELKLIDLNHDNTFDLFYKVAKNEESTHSVYQLYTVKNGVIKQLPIPKHNHIQARLLDDFKVEITLNPNMKPIIKDISSDDMIKYIDQNLYEEDGKLIEDKRIKITPITLLEPVLISESKGYGLKSNQHIKGLDENDILGEIETLWYYQKDNWIILKSEWKDHD